VARSVQRLRDNARSAPSRYPLVFKLKAGEVQDGIVFVIVERKQLLKRFLLQAERQNLVDAYIDNCWHKNQLFMVSLTAEHILVGQVLSSVAGTPKILGILSMEGVEFLCAIAGWILLIS
jgi:hypothetical protein